MRRQRREEGQAVTAVSVTAMLLIMGAALWMIGPFSQGTSELSKLKSATDAAALAGAQQVVSTMWPNVQASLNAQGHGKHVWKCGSGQGRAQQFAAKNDAHVFGYCYFPEADRVEVRARTNAVTATKKREDARSVAGIAQRIKPCEPDEPLVETETGYIATAHCGDIQVEIYVPPTTKPLKLLTPPGQLKKMFTVRLIE